MTAPLGDSTGTNRPHATLPTAPPPDAVLPMRSPNAPAPGEPIPSHYRWCFGCGDGHPTGLHMRITAQDGLRVSGVFVPSEHHQGAPGLAHGGILSTALDEILGSLNWLLTAPAVTGRLEVDFRRPVPVGQVLHIDAEIVGAKGRKVFTRAIVRLGDSDGPVAVAATALFVRVPLQHFVDHGTAEHVQQAIADRAAGGPGWRPEGEEHTVELNP